MTVWTAALTAAALACYLAAACLLGRLLDGDPDDLLDDLRDI